jgi:hypothetical protein
MTKSIFIIGLLLLLASCNQSGDTSCPTASDKPMVTEHEEDKPLADEGCTPSDPDHGSEDPGEDPGEDPNEDPGQPGDDVPQEAGLFDADLVLTKFDAADEAKVRKAISIIKKVIRTSEFRDRVLNFTYNGKKQFHDNGGLTNEQIYLKLLDGTEDLRPETDYEMDLELELYYSSRSTVGYTYPSGLKIWMNTKYFDVYAPSEVARNVFHEWSHKLGFKHASSASTSRASSVPYALGSIMEELGKKLE